jgi:hypothetical protein
VGKYFPESFAWHNTISPLSTNSPIIGNVDANRNIKTTCIWLNLMSDTKHVVKYLTVLWLVTEPEHATCSSNKSSLIQVQCQFSGNHTGFTGRFERVSSTVAFMFHRHVFGPSPGVQRRCDEQDSQLQNKSSNRCNQLYVFIVYVISHSTCFGPLLVHHQRCPGLIVYASIWFLYW